MADQFSGWTTRFWSRFTLSGDLSAQPLLNNADLLLRTELTPRRPPETALYPPPVALDLFLESCCNFEFEFRGNGGSVPDNFTFFVDEQGVGQRVHAVGLCGAATETDGVVYWVGF